MTNKPLLTWTNETHTHEEWQEKFDKQREITIKFCFPDEFIIRHGCGKLLKIIIYKGTVNLYCEKCHVTEIISLEVYENLLIGARKS